MSAQDLEQRARELLVKWRYAEPANGSMASQNRRDAFRRCANELESVLRHQPAPVDLEQFRDAVECWHDAALPANDVEAERKAEADRLLSIIDNAGKVDHQPAPVVDEWCSDYHCAGDCGMRGHGWQHSPVVGDARMARALEWVRVMAVQDADGSHVSAIEEAIAAYDPNCGARTAHGRCAGSEVVSDLGNMFTAMRVEGRRRRESNRSTSPAILEKHGVAFEVKNAGAHLVVRHGDLVADFWPGTGKYKLRSAPTYKRGVFPLLRDLGVEIQP